MLLGEESPSISTLYQRHNPKLLRFVRFEEPRDAEDICAEVWEDIVAYLAREGTRFEEGLLFTMARRRIIDYRRKRKRRKTDSVSDEMFFERPAKERTEREVIGRLDNVARVQKLLGLLTEIQADVMLMRHLHDMSVDEVAERLGHSPGNVRIIHHRAMKVLRAAS